MNKRDRARTKNKIDKEIAHRIQDETRRFPLAACIHRGNDFLLARVTLVPNDQICRKYCSVISYRNFNP